MNRFTRRVALVVAGVGVVAGAAVGVAQAAAPGPSGASPAAVTVVPADGANISASLRCDPQSTCGAPDCPPGKACSGHGAGIPG